MPIHIEHRDDTPYKKELIRNLVAYNDQNGPLEHWEYIGIYATDDADALSGGVQGCFEWDWLHITHVWVKEPRQGLGGTLLRQIEQIARVKGKTGMLVDTFSFQARPFYEKMGFTHMGQIDNGAGPHTRFFLTKRFA